MDLSTLTSRLRGHAAIAQQGVRHIGGSADLDAALAGKVASTSLYAMWLEEAASAPHTTQVLSQRMTHRFAVVVALANRRDLQGAAAVDALAPLRAALKAALVGWVPNTANGEPVQFERGRFWRLEAGTLWWVDEFSVHSTFRSY